jgi:hypothetical protein
LEAALARDEDNRDAQVCCDTQVCCDAHAQATVSGPVDPTDELFGWERSNR